MFNKQMMVQDFTRKYVGLDEIKRFWDELKRWDESATSDCFYDVGVLWMLHESA